MFSFRSQSQRPDRKWNSTSLFSGTASGRSLRLTQQPLVERLEPRRLLAHVHYLVGPTATVTSAGGGQAVEVTGTIAGLGNEDVTIKLVAHGSQTTLCTNPGGNVVPGQNKDVTSTISQTFTPDQFTKNGSLSFDITTPPVTSGEVDGAPDCPNGNWTETTGEASFTSVDVIISQGGHVVSTRNVPL